MGRGRTDDTEETITKRLRVNQRDAEPVVNYFDEQKKLVRVNCEGTPEGSSLYDCANCRCVCVGARSSKSDYRVLGIKRYHGVRSIVSRQGAIIRTLTRVYKD
jgi:hypothetical protein